MQVDKFVEEMLDEVKDLKDLAKGELPIIAQEYIRASKVSYCMGLGLGLFFMLIAAGCCLYAYNYGPPQTYHDQDIKNSFYIVGSIGGAIGFTVAAINVFGLMDFVLQPRRMAIQAITSLLPKK